jgi:hypothetical protein
MGSWRPDQSKNARRVIWGESRGKDDDTWKDFQRRFRDYPELGKLRLEKIGSEIHGWRLVNSPSGESYWMSCLRFISDGMGYWTVMYRPDERHWRTTPFRDLPVGQAIESAAAWFRDKLDTP